MGKEAKGTEMKKEYKTALQQKIKYLSKLIAEKNREITDLKIKINPCFICHGTKLVSDIHPPFEKRICAQCRGKGWLEK